VPEYVIGLVSKSNISFSSIFPVISNEALSLLPGHQLMIGQIRCVFLNHR
jgi:hypothetical protein